MLCKECDVKLNPIMNSSKPGGLCIDCESMIEAEREVQSWPKWLQENANSLFWVVEDPETLSK